MGTLTKKKMASSIINGTYQDIVNLEAELRLFPKDSSISGQVLADIVKIMDSTRNDKIFVYGLAVLNRAGYSNDSLMKIFLNYLQRQ